MKSQANGTIVDAHCHIDLYPDRRSALTDAMEAGVIVFGATNRATEYRNARVVLGERENLILGIGVHPEAAGSTYLRHELTVFGELVGTTPLISEIGLDRLLANRPSQYFGDSPTMDAQTALLERILEHDLSGKTFSVHSRGASRQLADMLHGAGHPAVFHWFCDGVDDARYVADKGFEFSVNPAGLDPDLGSPEVVKWIPAELLHLETDGPFVKWNGRDMAPGDCRSFIAELAEFRGESVDALTEHLERNAARLLRRIDQSDTSTHQQDNT